MQDAGVELDSYDLEDVVSKHLVSSKDSLISDAARVSSSCVSRVKVYRQSKKGELPVSLQCRAVEPFKPGHLRLVPCCYSFGFGSQPRRFPGPIGYADLLEYHGFITEGRGNGRVPSGKTCKEKPLEKMSELPGTRPKNAYWWVELGGFTGPNQIDVQGMYPAMHAIDQSIHSKRAAYAAQELIPITDLELINMSIKCDPRYASGIPEGHWH